MEIYSNYINTNNRGSIYIEDVDDGNNCIPSFLFAILNRKNKYIEKYFLNADINTNIDKEKEVILLAKKIQEEFKFIYNILTNKDYRDKYSIIEKYKIDKLIKYFNEIIMIIKDKDNYIDYNTNIKIFIILLYRLYNIEYINYNTNNEKIQPFSSENIITNTINGIIIKKAKILFSKVEIIFVSNYHIYILDFYNNLKIYPNNLYINSIIIYNKNDSKFYYNKTELNNTSLLLANVNFSEEIIKQCIKISKNIFSDNEIILSDDDNPECYVYYSYL